MKILASPYRENSELNPVQSLLYDLFEKIGVQVSSFSGHKLLCGSWDIWHLHWPVEKLLGRRRGFRFLHLLIFWIELKVARLKKTKIFWTVHNLRPHERSHRLMERVIWRLFLPNIDGIICMSDLGKQQLLRAHPQSRSIPISTIPHGHYRGAYPDLISRNEARKALGIPPDEFVGLFIGQIRPYKGVEKLIHCFAEAQLTNAKLLVAGMADDRLMREIKNAAVLSSDVKLFLGFVDRNDIQKYLRATDLVILPYVEVLNSGSAILALSFDRPILVPDRGAMAELCNVVGPGWVSLYEGELSLEIIRSGVHWAKARQIPPDSRAPIDMLNWDHIARLTIEAFS